MLRNRGGVLQRLFESNSPVETMYPRNMRAMTPPTRYINLPSLLSLQEEFSSAAKRGSILRINPGIPSSTKAVRTHPVALWGYQLSTRAIR